MIRAHKYWALIWLNGCDHVLNTARRRFNVFLLSFFLAYKKCIHAGRYASMQTYFVILMKIKNSDCLRHVSGRSLVRLPFEDGFYTENSPKACSLGDNCISPINERAKTFI